jgi:hypothetical protein
MRAQPATSSTRRSGELTESIDREREAQTVAERELAVAAAVRIERLGTGEKARKGRAQQGAHSGRGTCRTVKRHPTHERSLPAGYPQPVAF